MGPSEDLPNSRINQERSRNRPCRRARSRRCLLKGCDRVYRPDHRLQRYCREECRREAKRWRRWKAQQKYRATARGKAKRKKQCQRLRDRRKAQKPVSEAAAGGARVTPIRFFRFFLRSPWLLQEVHENAAISLPTFLLARVSTCVGARLGAGTALEEARCGAPVGVRARYEGRTEPIERISRASFEIVPTYCQRPTVSLNSLLPTRRGRGNEESATGALRSLFFFMFWLEGERAELGGRRNPGTCARRHWRTLRPVPLTSSRSGTCHGTVA